MFSVLSSAENTDLDQPPPTHHQVTFLWTKFESQHTAARHKVSHFHSRCRAELDSKHRTIISASKKSIRRFVITERAPNRAFSWLKAATTAFTFKTLLRHYAKRVLTPRYLNVKLGPRRNYHKGRAAIRHYANQTARPL